MVRWGTRNAPGTGNTVAHRLKHASPTVVSLAMEIKNGNAVTRRSEGGPTHGAVVIGMEIYSRI